MSAADWKPSAISTGLSPGRGMTYTLPAFQSLTNSRPNGPRPRRRPPSRPSAIFSCVPSASLMRCSSPLPKSTRSRWRRAVHGQAVGHVQRRQRLGVGDDLDLALGRDAIDGAALALEVAGIADVDDAALGIDDDVVEEQRRRRERRWRARTASALPLRVDAQDLGLVGDEQPFLVGGHALGVVEAGGERHGLAVLDRRMTPPSPSLSNSPISVT